MNAYNPIATMNRLKGAGMTAKQAEALADEMQGAISTLVTHEQMQAAMDRLTIRLGLMVAGIVTLACTIMGVILSK